ncbi:MAG: L,D-transpeptidase family protein [Anaerostipes sp.]|nr:L,D-transpeptidase family protein [Anaerostipes sp.]
MNKRKKGIILFVAVLAVSILFGGSISNRSINAKTDKWDNLLTKYEKNPSINQMIFVKYYKKSKGVLYLYEKTNGKWKRTLKCTAYVGKKGIGKKKTGDMKTPVGVYNFTKAFGIKKNPGSKMKYTKLKNSHYWCADRKYYNRFVNVKKHKCNGEHLIKIKPQYNYCLSLNYNPKNKYGKGSAIFLHCTKKGRNYTAGCIAISEKNMKKVMNKVDKNAKICIYKK